jgi:hypothetical protein
VSYNATSSLAHFENKHIFFYFEKRSSLLQNAVVVVVHSKVVELALTKKYDTKVLETQESVDLVQICPVLDLMLGIDISISISLGIERQKR